MRLFATLRTRHRRCDNCIHWMSVNRQRGRCDRVDTVGIHPGRIFSGEIQLALPFPDHIGDADGMVYTRPDLDAPIRPMRQADQSCDGFHPIGQIPRFDDAAPANAAELEVAE